MIKGYIYVDKDGKVYRNNNVGDVKLGSVFPKANMAWRNDFSYKGFNLSVMVSARLVVLFILRPKQRSTFMVCLSQVQRHMIRDMLKWMVMIISHLNHGTQQ